MNFWKKNLLTLKIFYRAPRVLKIFMKHFFLRENLILHISFSDLLSLPFSLVTNSEINLLPYIIPIFFLCQTHRHLFLISWSTVTGACLFASSSSPSFIRPIASSFLTRDQRRGGLLVMKMARGSLVTSFTLLAMARTRGHKSRHLPCSPTVDNKGTRPPLLARDRRWEEPTINDKERGPMRVTMLREGDGQYGTILFFSISRYPFILKFY